MKALHLLFALAVVVALGLVHGPPQEVTATSSTGHPVVDQVTDVPSCVTFLSGLGFASSADATSLCQLVAASVPSGSTFSSFFSCLEGQVLGGAAVNDALSHCGSTVSVSTGSTSSGSTSSPPAASAGPSSGGSTATAPFPPPPPPIAITTPCTPKSDYTSSELKGAQDNQIIYGAQQTGWTIVGGPAGTVISGNVGPLMTMDASGKNYVKVDSSTPLAAGQGYLAYFNGPSPVTLASPSSQASVSVTLPAGVWTLVGNPFQAFAFLKGADCLMYFGPNTASSDPQARSYTPLNGLFIGEGGWAFSINGGTATWSLR